MKINQVTTLNDVIQQLYILTQAVLSNKNTLTLDECAAYTGLSLSHLYKLTSSGEIPHYKPRGKMLYFDRAEIDTWLRQNRVSTRAEIEQQAADHMAFGSVNAKQ
ncbi:helix-turn-helix transcriptional regulator [Candidatus Methylomicrobium oryzae]|uniref:helix-turn-helix transcriptional regulator n=1 Tax=Candidatus Methylomicrobium oryzae TaxID=2802053 RepID=UPI001921B077|nr:helix-turn-helix domain-containing protein [Methylomicrobium sp. RS1]MBL1262461.1 helix-turn-helix domain-containing protein [Methylomicrobium sp. RS1]